jgi:hypothetical protein
MKPVVLMQRTLAGDAVRYSRIEDGKVTHIVETAAVPPKQPVEFLDAKSVEEMRAHPKLFFQESN